MRILQTPDAGTQAAQQCPVVAHQQDRTLVTLERILQRLDRFHIEVIGRFIEHQQVGLLQRHHRQGDTCKLATRERTGATQHLVARKIEAAEMIVDLPASPLRTEIVDGVEQRLVARHLREVLPVRGDRRALPNPNLATLGVALSQDGREQGALAGAVGTDQTDHVAPAHRGGEGGEQHPALDPDGDILGDQHLITTALRRLEAQRHGAGGARRRREARHAHQDPPSPLGLLGILTGDVATDVVLLRRDRLGLLVKSALGGQAPLGALGDKIGIAAGVGEPSTTLEVEHVIGDLVEEGAVMADDQQSGLETPQMADEPFGRLEIEVVGRFIEQQQVSRGDELAGETQSPALTAAECGQLLGDGPVGIEAEAVQHRRDTGVNAVAVGALELLQVMVVAGQLCLGERIATLPHGMRLRLKRMLQREQLGERSAGRFPDGRGPGKGAMLVQLRPAQLGRPHDRPLGRGERAGHHAEEGGLAAAVAADDPPPLSGSDGQIDIGEQDVGAVLHRGAGDGKQRHRSRRAGL